MSDPKKKKQKKNIGFEPISCKFGTLEAEKITLFPAIILQLFSSYPPSGGFCKVSELVASHRNGDCCRWNVYLLKKLRPNLSEMEVRTFVRIQKVIWDQLLPCKAEIIQK